MLRVSPSRQPAKGPMTARTALLVMVGALVIGSLLNARSLAASASALSPGPVRTVAVAVTDGLVPVSAALGTDRPRILIESITTGPVDGGTAQPPRPVFVPSPNRPARLLVAGDSLVDPFGPEMAEVASGTGVIKARWEVQYSSGLTRPQLFDWSTYMKDELVERPADIVVFMVGANDVQPIETSLGWASSGTPEWEAEYRARVDALMEVLLTRATTVYWVGQPIARSPEHSMRMASLNAIYRSAAGDHDRVHFVDAWEVFTDADGGYSDFLADDSGRLVLMRRQDGVHLTPEGGERLARAVLDSIRLDWHIGS
jgi:hypothetical protein